MGGVRKKVYSFRLSGDAALAIRVEAAERGVSMGEVVEGWALGRVSLPVKEDVIRERDEESWQEEPGEEPVVRVAGEAPRPVTAEEKRRAFEELKRRLGGTNL